MDRNNFSFYPIQSAIVGPIRYGFPRYDFRLFSSAFVHVNRVPKPVLGTHTVWAIQHSSQSVRFGPPFIPARLRPKNLLGQDVHDVLRLRDPNPESGFIRSKKFKGFPMRLKTLCSDQMHLDKGLTPRAHVFNESAFLSGDQLSRVATVSMEKRGKYL